MKPFLLKHTVTKEEIDELNHVNNVVYVQWVQMIATEHWAELVKNQPDFHGIWVLIRHEIDYVKSAVLGDVITLKTWVGESSGLKSVRHVAILKGSELLAKSATTWCLLDVKTNKPLRLSESVLKILNPS